jgi:hypothetical protein
VTFLQHLDATSFSEVSGEISIVRSPIIGIPGVCVFLSSAFEVASDTLFGGNHIDNHISMFAYCFWLYLDI